MAKKTDEPGKVSTGEETSPESVPETTPEPEPEPGPIPTEETFTYTKKERDDLITAEKAVIGRALKDALTINTTLKTAWEGERARITALEADNKAIRTAARAKEIKEAAGDTNIVDALTLKHQNEDERLVLSKERSDIALERTQHQADIDEVAKTKATNLANDLAKTSGLTADLLLQIGSDQDKDNRTVYNLDRMKDIASKSPKVGGDEGEGEEEGGEKDTTAKGMRAKAASTGRAATNLRAFADFEKAYVEGTISREEYGKAAKRFNIQL